MSVAKDGGIRVAFIGSAGVPNRYGGFESFLEHCGPHIASLCQETIVTCYERLYADRSPEYEGMHRMFVGIPANGSLAPVHDLLAMSRVFRRASHIVVLGVSAGMWFPLFRIACDLADKRLIVNTDGIEWRRNKHGLVKRALLRGLDWLAQRCAHTVVCDNAELLEMVPSSRRAKVSVIEYSGDHVLRVPSAKREAFTALTICRIEPENNIPMLVDGARLADVAKYTIVGNWNASAYGRRLRASYARDAWLVLRDPLYDPLELARLRESCEFYLHGHSVGGTNPSLVEMLFYDCRLLCVDVPYNRATAGGCASYFSTAEELAALFNEAPATSTQERAEMRRKYSHRRIAQKYLELFKTSQGCGGKREAWIV